MSRLTTQRPSRPRLLSASRGATLLLLLILVAVACNSGSSAPAPADPDPVPDPGPIPEVLHVVDVFPRDLAARTGSSVRFVAQTSAPVSSFAWDFGGGGEPNTSTLSQPLVLLGTPGTYTGSLSVCAADCAESFAFTYRVDPVDVHNPQVHILEIMPTGEIGKRGDDVMFSARLQGLADHWEWDFGRGMQVEKMNGPTPVAHLLRPGVYEGRLTVKLSGGDEDTLPFAYTVAAGIAEEPPFVDRIDLPAPWVCDNKTFQASAQVLSDFPITYEWTLSSPITPEITTNSVARFITPREPGTYTIELRTRNQFGESPVRQQSITVGACPDTSAVLVADPAVPRGVIRVDRTTIGEVHKDLRYAHGPANLNVLLHHRPWSASYFILGDPESKQEARFWATRFSRWGTGDVAILDLPAMPEVPRLPNAELCFLANAAPVVQIHPTYLTLKGDRILLIYADSVTDVLRYTLSTGPDPRATEDWESHSLPGDIDWSPTSHQVLCSTEADFPVIYVFGRDDADQYLAVSQVADPTTTADWHLIDLSVWHEAGSPLERCAGFRRSGELLVVERHSKASLLVKRAIRPDIGSINDFRNSTLTVPSLPGPFISLKQIADRGGYMQILFAHTHPNRLAIWSEHSSPQAHPSDFRLTEFPAFPGLHNSPWQFDALMLAKPDRLTIYGMESRDFGYGFTTTADQPSTFADWEAVQLPQAFPDRFATGQPAVADNRWMFVQRSPLGSQLLWEATQSNPIQGQDWRVRVLRDPIGSPFTRSVSAQVASPFSNLLYFAEITKSEESNLAVYAIPFPGP